MKGGRTDNRQVGIMAAALTKLKVRRERPSKVGKRGGLVPAPVSAPESDFWTLSSIIPDSIQELIEADFRSVLTPTLESAPK